MLPKSFEEHGFVIGFSPPYGDGTIIAKSASVVSAFSPPYGDSTGIRPLFAGGALVFAPLRGWYSDSGKLGALYRVFAPLRGLYTNVQRNREKNKVFAPLRGWYGDANVRHL